MRTWGRDVITSFQMSEGLGRSTGGFRNLFVLCLIAASLSLFPGLAKGQVYTFETYAKEIDRGSKVTSLPEFGEFGETTDYSSGATTFRKTVVEIPGNNDLRVAVDYIVKLQFPWGGPPRFTFERNLPYIEGTHSFEYGWVAGYAPTSFNLNRCSDSRALSQGAATIRILKPLDNIIPTDYWSGNSLYVPEDRGGFVRPISPGEIGPSGIDVKWATNSGWRFSCYTLADGSEGFVGHRPNGDKYFFGAPVGLGQLSQVLSPNRPDVDGWLDVDKFRMYVTRIEDRFGNWVNYEANQIVSSDGRTITFPSATTVQANGKQWAISGSTVANPDGSTWTLSIQQGFGITSSELLNSCQAENQIPPQYSGQATIRVTTESGATGTFLFQPRRRGFSQVSFHCRYALSGSKASSAYSETMHFTDEIALVTRTVSGPGISTYTHAIDYGPVNACYSPAGATHPPPNACTASSPTVRTTTITGPGGSIRTLTYGTRFYQDAGLLLATTEGGLRSTSYEHIPLYTNSMGTGMSMLGYDVSSYLVSGVRKETTVLQGRAFTKEVPSTCGPDGTAPCFDNLFRPTKIIRSSHSL